MNDRTPPSETKLPIMMRHKEIALEKSGREGVGRALMTIYPAAREQILPEDMKRLLNEIGWSDQDSDSNSGNSI